MNKSFTKYDLFFLAALLLCCFKLLFGFENTFDIPLDDDIMYLGNGVTHQLSVEYAPLYSLLFYMLKPFFVKNLDLLFFIYKLLTYCYVFMIYSLLRNFKLEPLIAFVFSVIVLLCQLNMPLTPKVVILMNCMQLIILYVAYRKSNNELRDIIIFLLLFVSYYIRPEYKVSLFLFFVYFVIKYAVAFYKGNFPQKWSLLVFLFVFVAIVSLKVGFPFQNHSGKELLAFEQHFSLNYVKWNNLSESPFTNSHYFLLKVFGDVKSPIEAMFANPTMFFTHIITNVKNYLWIFLHIIIPAFLPINIVIKSLLNIILFFCFTAVFLLWYLNNYQFTVSAATQKLKRYFFMLFILVLLVVPNVISILLIAPRYHYVAMQIPIFIVVFSVLIAMFFKARVKQKNNLIRNAASFAAIVFALIAVPVAEKNNFMAIYINKRPNYQKVQDINSLPISINKKIHPINCDLLLFSKYKYGNKHINYIDRKNNFYDFLKENDINLIDVNDAVSEIKTYKEDKNWQNFLIKYQDYGFEKVVVNKSVFLVKRELLK